MFKLRHLLTIFNLSLVGCSDRTSPTPMVTTERPVESPQITIISEIISPFEIVSLSAFPEVEDTAEVVNAEAAASPDARIRIVTTFDWTIFRIVRGGALEAVEILSSSPEVNTAIFDQDYFQLIQSIYQTERGNAVELVANLSLLSGSLRGNLEFEIDRGHIGGTTVEIFSYACINSVSVASFTGDEIQESGENI